jgi:ribonuclease Z
MQDLRIVFLGTSSGTPSRERNVTAVALVLDGTVLLFDCGEGTQRQLLRAPVRSGAIDAIFVSHLHGDHVYGIPGLLGTFAMNARERPLAIVGAEGVEAYVQGVLATTHHHSTFPIEFSAPPYRGRGFTVMAAPLEHRVPSLGYCVVEDERPGKFDPEKALALGIEPGPIYAELIRTQDPRVVGPSQKGRRVAIVTDTRPCAAAVELARGADVLIHECTYGEEMRQAADERGHSTAAGAARIAAEAEVGLLLLTHFSVRYGNVTPLVEEARAIFPRTEAAADLMTLEVGISGA